MPNIVLTTEQQEAKNLVNVGIHAYQRGASEIDRAGDAFAKLYNTGLDKHLVNAKGELIENPDAYIAAACGCDKATVSRLMAASTVRALLPSGNKPIPEGTIRPLAKFVPKRNPKHPQEPTPGWESKIEDAYEKACGLAEDEQAKRVTSKHVSRAVKEMGGTPGWHAVGGEVAEADVPAPVYTPSNVKTRLMQLRDGLHNAASDCEWLLGHLPHDADPHNIRALRDNLQQQKDRVTSWLERHRRAGG